MENVIEKCPMCDGPVVTTGKNIKFYKNIDADEIMRRFDKFQKWLKGECGSGERNKNHRIKK